MGIVWSLLEVPIPLQNWGRRASKSQVFQMFMQDISLFRGAPNKEDATQRKESSFIP